MSLWSRESALNPCRSSLSTTIPKLSLINCGSPNSSPILLFVGTQLSLGFGLSPTISAVNDFCTLLMELPSSLSISSLSSFVTSNWLASVRFFKQWLSNSPFIVTLLLFSGIGVLKLNWNFCSVLQMECCSRGLSILDWTISNISPQGLSVFPCVFVIFSWFNSLFISLLLFKYFLFFLLQFRFFSFFFSTLFKSVIGSSSTSSSMANISSTSIMALKNK